LIVHKDRDVTGFFGIKKCSWTNILLPFPKKVIYINIKSGTGNIYYTLVIVLD
jgi:hypothetical protein